MKNKLLLKKIRNIFLVFGVNIFLVGIITPILIFYGPFKNIRNFIVDRSLNSTSHKYVAEFFLTHNEVQAFYEKREKKSFDKQDINIGEGFKAEDKNLVEVEEINTNKNFKGYMLIVHDPKRVKVGYTKELGKVGEKTSSIAKRNNAIAAINGGGFYYEPVNKSRFMSTSSLGDKPLGFIISDGKVVYDDKDDKKRDVIAFNDKGVLIVGKYSLEEVKNLNIKEAICFGPALVINGKAQNNEQLGIALAPRTAIGQKKDGTVLMLVVNNISKVGKYGGASLKDLEEIMLKYEAETAINLDGGGSTAMFYNGEILNFQTFFLGERTVPSIVYVK